ncbi:TonB-dependent receptor [Sphingosinicellaceae bacterium]|nr:TonB-dependent receptor [Sphingosinicellaceae bacterium]
MQLKHLYLLGSAALCTVLPFRTLAADLAAADAASDAAAATDDTSADIVVLGFGQSRQVQSVTSDDIARLTPGTSPIKAIEKLPGVNFQSADAFGAYEWSARISLRGFNQNQLGFTLDDVPLGDMSYGNYNGLHISRALISENLGSVEVAQGSGALGTASTSNLGGTLQFHSRAPSETFDIVGSGTYGSDSTYRGFVRVDSGDITGNGLRGYLSYGYLKTDKWKGYGEQKQHQVNAKLVQDFGDRGSITGFFNFSDRREQDYQDLSLDIINRLGYNNDNISNNFPLAQQLAQVYDNQVATAGGKPLPYPTAGIAFPAPYKTVDDVYYDAGGLRKDYLTGATIDAHLTDRLEFKLTGYYHDNKGQGVWYLPYQPTPGGSSLSVRTTEYGIRRGGTIARLSYDTGANHLDVGGWYESNTFRQARRFYGLANQATPSRPTLQFNTDPFFTQFDVKFDTETMMYYVSDKLDLGDRLTVTGGWKGYKVINSAHPIVNTGGLATGKIDATDWFLPQAGVLFRVTDHAELFGNFTQNMRAFVSAATSGPFAATQFAFDTVGGNLKPERSNTYEAGGRIRSGGFQASIAGYYVDFKNRLLNIPIGNGPQGLATGLANVGAVRTYGAEVSATYRIAKPLSLYASYAYNHSKYKDNVVDVNGNVQLTGGKFVVDSPEHMLKGEIAYDDDTFLARVGADYMSKRYFTYSNDESVPGRVTLDASIGYRIHGHGFINGVSIEGNVTNLTDKRYVSTIGSNGYTFSGDSQTLLAAAPRQWFVTLKRGF